MTYSIGEVAERFSLSVSTLRYYDKEGLFPELERVSGVRRFSERDIEGLKVIECLKKSGLEIKEIRQFMEWCKEGRETYRQRYELFQKQKMKVAEELKRIRRVQDMLIFKCWFYENLLSGAQEEELNRLESGKIPLKIRKAYINAFSEEG
ncbi:MerR family transcriptional regulator [Corynebacterium sp. 3HC-13]|uniref:MerR family transcriptional regulator n=1 Tax=Corynebacterium poyangense TaxID=2684405 RepID=UPI001CCE079C|nr:MerR family transcriptional regulator [Corynebacterium poyangense]MBZ8177574.1 MerR family transcriptional regulator [Corynebacterium poyangense]